MVTSIFALKGIMPTCPLDLLWAAAASRAHQCMMTAQLPCVGAFVSLFERVFAIQLQYMGIRH